MSKVQLKKNHWNRKRFVFKALSSLEVSWYDQAQVFLKELSNDSNYQINAHSNFIKFIPKTLEFFVGFEVIGVLNESWHHDEFTSSDHVVYQMLTHEAANSLYDLKTRAEQIHSALGNKMANVVYFQLDQDNLSLHFFYQKDYSQVN